MGRRLEPVDLMVAVGVFATILGAYTFFLAANGAIGGSVPEAVSTLQTPEMIAFGLVQEELGRGIVEEAVLSRRASVEIQRASAELNQAISGLQRVQGGPVTYLERAMRMAQDSEGRHAARVQYVLGRMIVNATARGVPSELTIRVAEATGKRMDQDFQSHHQWNLGHAIMTASLAHTQTFERGQQRLGNAVVHLAQVQRDADLATKATEVQLTAVVAAATRAEALADRLTQLAAIEPTAAQKAAPYVPARTIPDIPVSILASASVAAILIFLAGVTMGSRREEEKIGVPEEARTPQRYRKAG